MAVWHSLEHFFTDPFPEFHYPFFDDRKGRNGDVYMRMPGGIHGHSPHILLLQIRYAGYRNQARPATNLIFNSSSGFIA